MQANEISDAQEFVNGLREQGLTDTEIAAELEKRAATPEGQAEQATAVKAATAAKPKRSGVKAVSSKPAAKPKAKAAAKPAAKPAAPKSAPKKDDGTIRIHLSDTVFKAIAGAKDWQKANTRGWKALKASEAVRAAKSIPANHYFYPVMQREDVTSLATLLGSLSEVKGAKRYAGLLNDQAKV